MTDVEQLPDDALPLLIGAPWPWSPMCRRPCDFGPDIFASVMENLLYNPNQLSSWLFRADMVREGEDDTGVEAEAADAPELPVFAGFSLVPDSVVVCRLIPRNTLRDRPMLQTSALYESTAERGGDDGGDSDDSNDSNTQRSLVVYLPHMQDPAAMPFYHPTVHGVAFLHAWQPLVGRGVLSMHFAQFAPADLSSLPADCKDKTTPAFLARVALNLLSTVYKHGHGRAGGYTKRVHHDRIVPQARVQNRYAQLKSRHARRLLDAWQETTDPAKHVFEDLAIAAFLMELWADMYGAGAAGADAADAADAATVTSVPASFPGFVDVGCGNGLLVHVLNLEGYRGWGFDARARRSWPQYGGTEEPDSPLRQALLLPALLLDDNDDDDDGAGQKTLPVGTLPGTFPPGTFLVANHADELTVWTPVLAALSDCPFLAIPCCSHNFTGAKFRASPPAAAKRATLAAVSRDASSSSTYASFVSWVMDVAADCAWDVEREMLRIPSTRNVGLIGRRRRAAAGAAAGAAAWTTEQAWDVIRKYGGAHGFAANVAKLVAESSKLTH